MWHENHWYHYLERDDANLTRVEPLESNVKWINGGRDTVNDKIVIISIFYLGWLYGRTKATGCCCCSRREGEGPAQPGWPATACGRARWRTGPARRARTGQRRRLLCRAREAAGLGPGAASARWATVTGPTRERRPVWRRLAGELEEDGWPWSSSPEKRKMY
jgi:hypothetical protein